MGVALLTSCAISSTDRAGNGAAPLYVRKLDFSAVPHTEALAERARQTGNEMYPKVCALLADGDTDFPRHFDICLKPKLPKGHSGEARITHIRLNAACLSWLTNDFAALDQTLIHEMAHVAQHYERPLLGRWVVSTHNPPSWWREGMADYVCFKLSHTNGLRCAQCGYAYPDYRSGYSCAGAFLLYLDTTYNSNIVRQLNTVLRHGGYSDAFFTKATGKELPELWAEFRRTAAFTPSAARMLEFQQQLGYVNGKPPKNIKKRFNAYVDQHADALTKYLLKAECTPGLPEGDLSTRIALFLYFTQPGGTAETYLIKRKNEHLLPGFLEGQKGNLTGFLSARDLDPACPATRSFTATKKGDASTYHYTVCRASQDSGWKLQRAWRGSVDGRVAEEYPVH